MKKIKTLLFLLAIIGLSVNMQAQTGIYKGTADVKCPILSLDVKLDDIAVILKTSVAAGHSLVVDQIDLGGGTMTPIIEIPNVTVTPSGTNYTLTAPEMNMNIPEITVSGTTYKNMPAKVKLINGLVAGNTITLKLDVTAMVVVTINIDYSGTKTDEPLPGEGSEGKPWEIWKLRDLYIFSELVWICPQCLWAKYIKLMKDITFTDYQSEEPWSPIGLGPDFAFYGHFDGNNKKITGLKIKGNQTPYQKFVGLFGYVGNGSIKDLGIEDVDVDFNYDFQETADEVYVGGVAACLGWESKITNCYSTGKVRNATGYGVSYTGGIVGRVSEQGKVSNSYSTADVESTSETYAVAGGIAGFLYTAAVKNCYSTGEVSSICDNNSTAGGVVGEIGENYGDAVSNVSECAALNPKINSTGLEKYFGRIAGKLTSDPVDTLARNSGFAETEKPDGETEWDDPCEECPNGQNISKEEIYADGTIGNLFLAINGWTVENKKLPGLFGYTVNMPNFLIPVGIKTIPNDGIQVYPNPTSGQLRITNYELRIDNVEIFDMMGRIIPLRHSECSEESRTIRIAAGRGSEKGWQPQADGVVIDLTVFPAGAYFLKITTETGIITKKIIKH